MKQLIYISNITQNLNENELITLLQKARIKNEALNITGLLIYSEGMFLQVLEGPMNNVDALFHRIEQDPRHNNIIILVDKAESKKTFPDWSMGFASVNPKKTNELIGYIQSSDYLIANDLNNSASLLIRIFINNNNLVISY